MLQQVGESGVSGSATFRGNGLTTRVAVQVEGGDQYPFLAAHIHDGGCDAMNPIPQYRLAPVQGGRSDTTIAGSLESLFRGETLSLNVHTPAGQVPAQLETARSAVEEIETSLACGELRTGDE